MNPIRLVLADDHRIVLEGLAQLFSLESDIDVVMRCTDGVEALDAVARLHPDVLVADVKMPNLSGIDVLRRLRESGSTTRVVLLTAHVTNIEVLDAIRLGVGGIILKEAAPRTLVQCVRKVAAGEQWLNEPAIRDAIAQGMVSGKKATAALTRRETDIVRMVAVGLRNKEIADRLAISEGTVKMHLHSIYEKLGMSGRVELSIYARDNALV